MQLCPPLPSFSGLSKEQQIRHISRTAESLKSLTKAVGGLQDGLRKHARTITKLVLLFCLYNTFGVVFLHL
jgi:hypothetical protein